jgi:expansin
MRAWRTALLLTFVASCARCREEKKAPPPEPACADDTSEHRGEATFYDATGGGACSFEPTPDDLLVAAISRSDNPDAAACGACLDVVGPGGSVIVRVVDSCPGCDPGDLDLSRSAFARIADTAKGRVPITWRHVPCAVDGPVRYRFKDNSNASWTAVQVRNHRYAIARFEVRGRDGTFHDVPRATYNYFVDRTGMGAGPYAFRITDARGQVLEEPSVPLSDGSDLAGTAQLAKCRPAPPLLPR